MKRVLSLMLVAVIAVFSTSMLTFAGPGQSLDEVIGQATTSTEVQNEGSNQEVTNPGTGTTSTTGTTGNVTTENNGVVEEKPAPLPEKTDEEALNAFNQAGNLLNPTIEGVEGVTSGARTVAAFIVQVLSYVIIVFLAVRIMLDLAFIALPFTRTFLANGYSGQAQSSGQGMMNPGMGTGMGGMGMGGMGMGGMGGMGMGGYGRGGYGMRGGMGMGGMGMQNQMAGQNAMMNRNSSMVGNIQFVSNAALNAVATESAIGPDGKTQSPFKIYAKDMMVTLIIVPILIVLAATGVVTDFGLLLANFIVDCIEKLGGML